MKKWVQRKLPALYLFAYSQDRTFERGLLSPFSWEEQEIISGDKCEPSPRGHTGGVYRTRFPRMLPSPRFTALETQKSLSFVPELGLLVHVLRKPSDRPPLERHLTEHSGGRVSKVPLAFLPFLCGQAGFGGPASGAGRCRGGKLFLFSPHPQPYCCLSHDFIIRKIKV